MIQAENSASQKKCGIRAANAMYHLITDIGVPQPQVESIKLEKALYSPDKESIITIKYKNLCGDLKSNGTPYGFAYRKVGSSEKPMIQNMSEIKLQKNVVKIRIEKNIEEVKDYEIFYGFGHDFYCNITDGDDRAIPSMGPIRILEYV